MRPDWTVTTDDGVKLGVKTTEPVGPCRGELLLLHAMMVDARSLDRPHREGLASVLAAAGYRVHRADLRGRGMSEVPADWSYDDLVYRDVPALCGALGRPWVVGHSLGGHVTAASWAMGSCEIAGLVGLGANVWMPSLEPSRRRRMAKRLAMGLLDLSLRRYGRIAARRVKMGPVDEAGGYGRDLLRYWREDRWADRSGRDWLGALSGVEGPSLFVLSRGDRLLAHPVGARRWADNIPGAEVWELDAGGHMALGVDGESAPMWRRLAEWMRARDE